jgi:hypothetical protein
MVDERLCLKKIVKKVDQKIENIIEVEGMMRRQSKKFINTSRLLFVMLEMMWSTTMKVEEDQQNNIWVGWNDREMMKKVNDET